MPRLAYFAHANVFHHRGRVIPTEIALATIPEKGSEPEVAILHVDHSNLPMTSKDWRTNRWINDRIHLPLTSPGSIPPKWIGFFVRGKYTSMDKGEGGLVVVKGPDQEKIFESCGLPVLCLDHLPKFKELNDYDVPADLHKIHEGGDTSECSMVKAYRFARYLTSFVQVYDELNDILLDE